MENIIKNEEIIDNVADAVEAIPVEADKTFGKFGKAAAVTAGVIIIGTAAVATVRYVKKKKAQKAEAESAAAHDIIDTHYEMSGFENNDSEEE